MCVYVCELSAENIFFRELWAAFSNEYRTQFQAGKHSFAAISPWEEFFVSVRGFGIHIQTPKIDISLYVMVYLSICKLFLHLETKSKGVVKCSVSRIAKYPMCCVDSGFGINLVFSIGFWPRGWIFNFFAPLPPESPCSGGGEQKAL